MLSTYQEFELVIGTILFAALYTASYNAHNPSLDIANIFFTTIIFAFSYWVSIAGASYFTYNKTQSLDTPSANQMIQPLP